MDTANNAEDNASGVLSTRQAPHGFWVGLARAFGGAVIFSLPLMMTMEMWTLGFSMAPLRLALLLAVTVPLLVGLSYFSGFQETMGWVETVVDAFVAYGAGFVAPAIILLCMGLLHGRMSWEEVVGSIALQAVPGSMGAALARSQFGSAPQEEEQKEQQAGYGGELFLMIVGALFLAFNVAPTEEMVLISVGMTHWHAVALAAVSLAIMHGFVYAIEFRGQASLPPGTPFWSAFVRFTVVGYALAMLLSLYVLWTFGRLDGAGIDHTLMMMTVLSFPAAIGAAAARLIL